VTSALALLSGVTITIIGCSGGGSSGGSTYGAPTGSTPPVGSNGGGVEGLISDNHGHRAAITSAELTAGDALSLGIQGAADHPHTVALTSADLAAIRGNQRVTKTSTTGSTDGHFHSVVFSLSATPDPGTEY
jgi:hypothetical protein